MRLSSHPASLTTVVLPPVLLSQSSVLASTPYVMPYIPSAVVAVRSDVGRRPLLSVSAPPDSSALLWSPVSRFLLRLSDELHVELRQFAGRDWRLAAYNLTAMASQLDALANAAHVCCNNGLTSQTWDELHDLAEGVLASITSATVRVQHFIASKEAECTLALRQLLNNQRWRDAQLPSPHLQHNHANAADSAAGYSDSGSGHTARSSSSSSSSSSSTQPNTPTMSHSLSASPPSSATSLLLRACHSAVPCFSPSFCLSFARVICEVHPRDADRQLPAMLYRWLLLDRQQPDQVRLQRQQHVASPLPGPLPTINDCGSGCPDYHLCRTVLSISRCLDHLLHFHLLHHLARYHLLAAFQQALAPAGPISAILSAAHNALATAPLANTGSLLALSAYLSSLMQSLQVGHTDLAYQQREIRSARCAACHEPLSVSHIVLLCGHTVCYKCMLVRIGAAGASCVCGGHSSMPQLRIDTVKSALTLTPQMPPHQQQQEAAVRASMERPPSLQPPATPPSPMTPLAGAAAMELAMGHASAEPARPADSPLSALPAVGHGGGPQLANGLNGFRHEILDQTRPFKRAASYSLLSHSASTSSLSSSAFSSLSPPRSESPDSPPRPANTHSRRSSVPNLLRIGTPSSSSSSITSTNGGRRSLTRGRSRSARKLSDTFSTAAAVPTGFVVVAASVPRHVLPRIASTSSQSSSSSRSSPIPLMATVIEPARDTPPPPVVAARLSTTVNSCHQCKSAKPRIFLMLCSSPAERTANRQRKCRKKYCQACLLRCYKWPFVQGATQWTCPACEGLCSCALCQRGREQRKAGEVSEAAEEDEPAQDGEVTEMPIDSAVKP